MSENGETPARLQATVSPCRSIQINVIKRSLRVIADSTDGFSSESVRPGFIAARSVLRVDRPRKTADSSDTPLPLKSPAFAPVFDAVQSWLRVTRRSILRIA
jgi:hypothetical protein